MTTLSLFGIFKVTENLYSFCFLSIVLLFPSSLAEIIFFTFAAGETGVWKIHGSVGVQ